MAVVAAGAMGPGGDQIGGENLAAVRMAAHDQIHADRNRLVHAGGAVVDHDHGVAAVGAVKQFIQRFPAFRHVPVYGCRLRAAHEREAEKATVSSFSRRMPADSKNACSGGYSGDGS